MILGRYKYLPEMDLWERLQTVEAHILSYLKGFEFVIPYVCKSWRRKVTCTLAKDIVEGEYPGLVKWLMETYEDDHILMRCLCTRFSQASNHKALDLYIGRYKDLYPQSILTDTLNYGTFENAVWTRKQIGNYTPINFLVAITNQNLSNLELFLFYKKLSSEELSDLWSQCIRDPLLTRKLEGYGYLSNITLEAALKQKDEPGVLEYTIDTNRASRLAARYYRPQVLHLLIKRGLIDFESAWFGAILGKNTLCMHILSAYCSPWSAYFMSYAARFDLRALQFLRQKRCRWNEKAPACAAETGRLDILTYLHRGGCPWDWKTYKKALSGKYMYILEYLRLNNCPFDTRALEGVNSLEVVEWLEKWKFPKGPEIYLSLLEDGYDTFYTRGYPLTPEIAQKAIARAELDYPELVDWFAGKGFPKLHLCSSSKE